jgi:GTP-binding protein HflX
MLQTAIIAKRVTEGDPDTEEIRELTEAAGARVLGEVTQTRVRDPGTELGTGKVAEIADLVEQTGADTVVVDSELTPQQTVTLEDAIGARVIDRHRVVLEIFAQQARTRRAQLQVELARLRYERPRIGEEDDVQRMNIMLEKGTRLDDVRERIDELERKLDDLPSVDEQFREQRREQGYDLLAIAGYTNAGKSTLLRRLADDMQLGEKTHADLEETAGVENRLFKSLETTTRRATLDGREVLLTDTVGFLDDLPHWLVESFRGTLREVEEADAVVLVADLAQPTEELRRKLETVHETLGDNHPSVVTVLNKADVVPEDEQAKRFEAVAELAPNPVVTSARYADELDGVTDQLLDALPSLDSEELTLPLTDDAMSLVSWIHDEATDAEVTYEGERAVVEFTARPATVEQARAKAEQVATST